MSSCSSPMMIPPALLQIPPASGTVWPECGRSQPQAPYPASQPRREAPRSGNTRQLWDCPQSSDTLPSLEGDPLMKKVEKGIFSFYLEYFRRILHLNNKREEKKTHGPEALAVLDCVSHSTLTADSKPLLRDTVRKTTLPPSSATTSVFVLHEETHVESAHTDVLFPVAVKRDRTRIAAETC